MSAVQTLLQCVATGREFGNPVLTLSLLLLEYLERTLKFELPCCKSSLLRCQQDRVSFSDFGRKLHRLTCGFGFQAGPGEMSAVQSCLQFRAVDAAATQIQRDQRIAGRYPLTFTDMKSFDNAAFQVLNDFDFTARRDPSLGDNDPLYLGTVGPEDRRREQSHNQPGGPGQARLTISMHQGTRRTHGESAACRGRVIPSLGNTSAAEPAA